MFVSQLALMVLIHAISAQNASFPAGGSYYAALYSDYKSTLCAGCIFEGYHYFNSDPSKQYALIQWKYHYINESNIYYNFDTLFQGKANRFYMISSNPINITQPDDIFTEIQIQSTNCIEIPYFQPIFNYSWNNDAKYMGLYWFENRLTYRWTNVYPFIIQGEVAISDYFQDVYTMDPRGFNSSLDTIIYGSETTQFNKETPDDTIFQNIANADCIKGQSTTDLKDWFTKNHNIPYNVLSKLVSFL